MENKRVNVMDQCWKCAIHENGRMKTKMLTHEDKITFTILLHHPGANDLILLNFFHPVSSVTVPSKLGGYKCPGGIVKFSVLSRGA